MTIRSDDPIAFFITWTVYGTHLQGDERGWRKRRHGEQPPEPTMAQWRGDRLSHPVILLSLRQRTVVEAECRLHSDHRGWKVWEINARSNHVHVVVTAVGHSGKVVRDQLKANGTRGLREHHAEFRERPVWTVGGDWQCINNEEELDTVCEYVREAKDRMPFKESQSAGTR